MVTHEDILLHAKTFRFVMALQVANFIKALEAKGLDITHCWIDPYEEVRVTAYGGQRESVDAIAHEHAVQENIDDKKYKWSTSL